MSFFSYIGSILRLWCFVLWFAWSLGKKSVLCIMVLKYNTQLLRQIVKNYEEKEKNYELFLWPKNKSCARVCYNLIFPCICACVHTQTHTPEFPWRVSRQQLHWLTKKLSSQTVIFSWLHSCFLSSFCVLSFPQCSLPPVLLPPLPTGRQGDPASLLLSIQMLNHCDSLHTLLIVSLTKSCLETLNKSSFQKLLNHWDNMII